MAVLAYLFHPRSPPLSFSVSCSLLHLGHLSPCSPTGLFGRRTAKAWPPLRTRRMRMERLVDSRWSERNLCCSAHFAEDAPFTIAIGACIFNSLVFPVRSEPEDVSEDINGGAIDTTDMRFAVMGILSFLPYFNWMSWIFSWLDTSRQRYLVYSVVYLAPYLRTNMLLSPDESWLPIASILACIIHVQLEASITSGDIQGIPVLEETFKQLLSRNQTNSSDHRRRTKINEKEQGKKLGGGDAWREMLDDITLTNRKEDSHEEGS